MTARVLRLTKHHGLGNDFLVLLDLDDCLVGPGRPVPDTAALAVRVCDRRRGVGADGLLVATHGTQGSDVTMELRNADGTRAEMSGNGIRCLAQAVWDVDAGSETLRVSTDAGLRVVRRIDAPRPGFVRACVDMGRVSVVGDAPRFVGGTVEAAAFVDAGNPHLVLLDAAVDTVPVADDGPRLEAAFPDGINIEWVWPGPGPGEVTLRVWERGAGQTEACGTGSCAAVAALASWGRVGRRAVVHNPGGDVTVELGDTALLTGPSARIAAVELPWP